MEKEATITPFKGKFSVILLFGPPGSGKATLGRFLSDGGMQYHLSSGEIFKSLPVSSDAGKLYYSYAKNGQFLPDDITIEIWKYYVQGLIATNSYYPESQDLLLDGLPRTILQAQMLQNYVKIRHVIVLEINDKEELKKRIASRARREGRVDDVHLNEWEKKIDSYHQRLDSILKFYPNHLVSKVNAQQKPLEVLRDVLVRLSHVLAHGPDY